MEINEILKDLSNNDIIAIDGDISIDNSEILIVSKNFKNYNTIKEYFLTLGSLERIKKAFKVLSLDES